MQSLSSSSSPVHHDHQFENWQDNVWNFIIGKSSILSSTLSSSPSSSDCTVAGLRCSKFHHRQSSSNNDHHVVYLLWACQGMIVRWHICHDSTLIWLLILNHIWRWKKWCHFVRSSSSSSSSPRPLPPLSSSPPPPLSSSSCFSCREL